MRNHRNAGIAIARTLAALLVASGLSGSMCSVSVCKEDCNPCLTTCQCHTCETAALGGRERHKLAFYRLGIVDDESGGVVRSFTDIVGLSLDLAQGPRIHAQPDFARFAEGVIESNGLLLQSRRDAWRPDRVEAFDASVVVSFIGEEAGASLSFLFDRGGTLLQIDEVRRDPR